MHKIRQNKLFRYTLIGALVLVGVLAVLELTNTTHIFHKPTPATQVVVKKGKVTSEPKNNVSAGSSNKKVPSSGSNNISGATDTSGNASAQTNPNQWIVATSGNITVKQPAVNAALQSGFVLSGSAKVDRVNFRLIDDQVGVISQGVLNVVNGNFSGNLNFTAHASSGRLDVFSTDSQGIELNEVQIAVSFK